MDEKRLKRDIKAIADDPNAYWIDGGDNIDCIARKGDKRYNEETLAPWLWGKNDVVGTQLDYSLELKKSIAGKCLGIVSGNHEEASLQYYDRDIYGAYVAAMAGYANKRPWELALGVQGFVRLSFKRGDPKAKGSSWPMIIYTHHGYGGGRLPGGHALALGRVLGDYDCDVALMGHRHVRLFADKTIIGAGQESWVKRYRSAHFVASYLDSYIIPSNQANPVDTYAENKGLPPGPIGATVILVVPDDRDHHTLISNDPQRGMNAFAGKLEFPE